MGIQKKLASMMALTMLVLVVLDSAAAFTTPTSSLSRALTANHGVKLAFPTANKSSRSKLSMSDVAAAHTSESSDDDPLFEPLGVGIKRDFSERLPLYKSDITDGLNIQVRQCSVLTDAPAETYHDSHPFHNHILSALQHPYFYSLHA